MSKMFKVNVSTVVFNDNGQVLIQKRSKDEDIFPGMWGIPGGTIEMKDVSVRNALKREVREEVMIEIDDIEFFRENIVAKEIYGVVYLVFISKYASGKAGFSQEVEEIRWVKKTEIDNYNFTPTTKEIIKEAYERKYSSNRI